MANNYVARLPLDLSGVSPDNLILREPHTLEPRDVRVVIPTLGAFFAEGFVLRDKTTGLQMVHGVDYKFSLLHDGGGNSDDPGPTALSGKEIYFLILITNPSVSNSIEIDYHALGGNEFASIGVILKMLDELYNDTRPLSYKYIKDLPAGFNPGRHPHDFGDLYGMEYFVDGVNRIRAAVEFGDQASHIALFKYIDDTMAKHLADPDPHPQYMLKTGQYTPDVIPQPHQITPAPNAVSVNADLTVTGSPYYNLYGIPHATSTFQVSDKEDFSNLIIDHTTTTGTVTAHVAPVLTQGKDYYWRLRYADTEGNLSKWSLITKFTTGFIIAHKPVVISPQPGALGAVTNIVIQGDPFVPGSPGDELVSVDYQIREVATGLGPWNQYDYRWNYIQLNANILNHGVQYSVRIRYHGSISGESPWSDVVLFTTESWPAAGTFIRYQCNGFTRYDVLADGSGGTYIGNPLINAPYCGFDPSWPATGTELGTFCQGKDLYSNIADGTGGSYPNLKQTNSPTCAGPAPYIVTPTWNEGNINIITKTGNVALLTSAFSVINGSDTFARVTFRVVDINNNPINTFSTTLEPTVGAMTIGWADLPGNGTYRIMARHEGNVLAPSQYSAPLDIIVNVPEDPIPAARIDTPVWTSGGQTVKSNTGSASYTAAWSVIGGNGTFQSMDIRLVNTNGVVVLTRNVPSLTVTLSAADVGATVGGYQLTCVVNANISNGVEAMHAASSQSSVGVAFNVEAAPPETIFDAAGIAVLNGLEGPQQIRDDTYTDGSGNPSYVRHQTYVEARILALGATGGCQITMQASGTIQASSTWLLPGHSANEVDILFSKTNSDPTQTYPDVIYGAWYQMQTLNGGNVSGYQGDINMSMRARNNPSDAVSISINAGYHELGYYDTPVDNTPPPGHVAMSCFPAGSLVLMADGNQVPIETIKAGDLVMSLGGEPVELLAVDTPVLGNRKMARFANNSMKWSEEHSLWIKRSHKQWWWTLVKETWLAEIAAGVIGGLLDNNSMLTGLDVLGATRFAHVDGWKDNEVYIDPSFGPETKLYLPRTDGHPVIVDGYVVGGGINERNFDYTKIDWDKELSTGIIRRLMKPAPKA